MAGRAPRGASTAGVCALVAHVCPWLLQPRVPECALVPAVPHPGPPVRGCRTLGAGRTVLSGSMRRALFLGAWVSKEHSWGRRGVCVCVTERERQTHRQREVRER